MSVTQEKNWRAHFEFSPITGGNDNDDDPWSHFLALRANRGRYEIQELDQAMQVRVHAMKMNPKMCLRTALQVQQVSHDGCANDGTDECWPDDSSPVLEILKECRQLDESSTFVDLVPGVSKIDLKGTNQGLLQEVHEQAVPFGAMVLFTAISPYMKDDTMKASVGSQPEVNEKRLAYDRVGGDPPNEHELKSLGSGTIKVALFSECHDVTTLVDDPVETAPMADILRHGGNSIQKKASRVKMGGLLAIVDALDRRGGAKAWLGEKVRTPRYSWLLVVVEHPVLFSNFSN
jgi:hypothetical protein